MDAETERILSKDEVHLHEELYISKSHVGSWGREIVFAIDANDAAKIFKTFKNKRHLGALVDVQTSKASYGGYTWSGWHHRYYGDTALHVALKQKKILAIHALLELNASSNIENNYGKTQNDLALEIFAESISEMKHNSVKILLSGMNPKDFYLLPDYAEYRGAGKEAWNLMMEGRSLSTLLPKDFQKRSQIVMAPLKPSSKAPNISGISKHLKSIIDRHTLFIPPKAKNLDDASIADDSIATAEENEKLEQAKIESENDRYKINQMLQKFNKKHNIVTNQESAKFEDLTEMTASIKSTTHQIQNASHSVYSETPENVGYVEDSIYDILTLLINQKKLAKRIYEERKFVISGLTLLSAENQQQHININQQLSNVTSNTQTGTGGGADKGALQNARTDRLLMNATKCIGSFPLIRRTVTYGTKNHIEVKSDKYTTQQRFPNFTYYPYRHITKLSTLTNMKYMRVEDSGISVIYEGLRFNDIITELVLSNAGITDAGVKLLVSAIPTMNSMVYLDLSQNAIGDDGGFMLAKMITQPNNSKIELNSQNISLSKKIDEEKEEEGEEGEEVVYSSTLRTLSVAGNRIKIAAVKALVQAALEGSINTLSVARNHFTEKDILEVKALSTSFEENEERKLNCLNAANTESVANNIPDTAEAKTTTDIQSVKSVTRDDSKNEKVSQKNVMFMESKSGKAVVTPFSSAKNKGDEKVIEKNPVEATQTEKTNFMDRSRSKFGASKSFDASTVQNLYGFNKKVIVFK